MKLFLLLSLAIAMSGCAMGFKQFGFGSLGARYEYEQCETEGQCTKLKAGAGMCTKSRND